MYKSTHPFILKSLYAIMFAPIQSKQSFSQQLKAVFGPRQSSYGRLASFINILDRIYPATSKILSRRVAKDNYFPWHRPQPARLIGSGAGAIVFKLDNLALRIYRKSYGSGLTSAFEAVRLYKQYFYTVKRWYQDKHNILLPMDFLVLQGPPLFQPIAASLQPYLPSSRKDLLKDFTQDELLAIAQAHPSFKQTLLFFLEQTLYTYYNKNACLDLLGDDNIVIVYRNTIPYLHILDTGILYLDDVKTKSPQRILQIQAVIKNLEAFQQILQQPSKNQNPSNMENLSSTYSTTQSLTAHIETHAAKYYPQLDPHNIQIQLTKKENRIASRLFYFDISDQSQTISVLVKVSLPKPQKNNFNAFKKPRLFPPTNPFDMPTLEHQALTSFQIHFQDVDPTQINTIKVLDFLADKHAIVMEVAQLPNLRSRYLEAARRLPGKLSHPVLLTFKNAGRWLRRFHAIPLKDYVQDRHKHPDDFIKNIEILIEYLIKTTHRNQYFTNLNAQITALANQYLPQNLPLGLSHGDFAARNILTNNQGTVTVIDTFAKWNAPIYEDIGYFLNNIRTSWFQIATLGLVYSPKRIAAYEKAFLAGYFQDTPIPYPQIKIFEILALLDKWADAIDRANTDSSRKLLKPIILTLTSLYTKKRLKQLLREIQPYDQP